MQNYYETLLTVNENSENGNINSEDNYSPLRIVDKTGIKIIDSEKRNGANALPEKSAHDEPDFALSSINSLTSNIAVLDCEGKIIEVNRAWMSFALNNGGVLKDLCPGSNYPDNCSSVFEKNSAEGKSFADGIRKVLKGEINDFSLTYASHTILEKRWFLGKVSKYIGHGAGKAVVMHTDITKSKETENELAKNEEKFRTMVQYSSDVITIIDGHGLVKYVSPSVKNILGYDAESRIGTSVFDLIHPDDAAKIEDAITKNVFVRGKIVNMEYWIKKADGNYICMESVAHNMLMDPNVNGIIINSRDITDRKFADDMTKSALAEKETLLKEIHHRVKNNLQIVTSLLKLQENRIADPGFKSVFGESINRIKTMGLIHQNLYQENNLREIDFGHYIHSIINYLMDSYNANDRNIKCLVKVQNIRMNLETAIPCALIVNELVSNSLKHGFPGNEGGELVVRLDAHGENVISIMDNGVGLPKAFEFDKAKTLGMELVKSLITQLDTKLKVDTTRGTKFSFSFKNLEYNDRICNKM